METNTDWSHPKKKNQIGNISRNVWKRINIKLSNLETKRKQQYQPGGIAIIATHNINPHIVEREEDKYGMRQ